MDFEALYFNEKKLRIRIEEKYQNLINKLQSIDNKAIIKDLDAFISNQSLEVNQNCCDNKKQTSKQKINPTTKSLFDESSDEDFERFLQTKDSNEKAKRRSSISDLLDGPSSSKNMCSDGLFDASDASDSEDNSKNNKNSNLFGENTMNVDKDMNTIEEKVNFMQIDEEKARISLARQKKMMQQKGASKGRITSLSRSVQQPSLPNSAHSQHANNAPSPDPSSTHEEAVPLGPTPEELAQIEQQKIAEKQQRDADRQRRQLNRSRVSQDLSKKRPKPLGSVVTPKSNNVQPLTVTENVEHQPIKEPSQSKMESKGLWDSDSDSDEGIFLHKTKAGCTNTGTGPTPPITYAKFDESDDDEDSIPSSALHSTAPTENDIEQHVIKWVNNNYGDIRYMIFNIHQVLDSSLYRTICNNSGNNELFVTWDMEQLSIVLQNANGVQLNSIVNEDDVISSNEVRKAYM